MAKDIIIVIINWRFTWSCIAHLIIHTGYVQSSVDFEKKYFIHFTMGHRSIFNQL